MKKLLLGSVAGLLLVSSISLEAGEKRFRIRLASRNGDVFGQPVSFQEVETESAPLEVPQPIPESATPRIEPIPEYAPGGAVPHPGGADVQTVKLYHRVKYEDLDNIHPHAEKKIVAVKDPCAKKADCRSCAPPCVYVMICVPPCDQFEYDVKRKDHSKVEYDYGDYEVEITSKKGVVEVDYDD